MTLLHVLMAIEENRGHHCTVSHASHTKTIRTAHINQSFTSAILHNAQWSMCWVYIYHLIKTGTVLMKLLGDAAVWPAVPILTVAVCNSNTVASFRMQWSMSWKSFLAPGKRDVSQLRWTDMLSHTAAGLHIFSNHALLINSYASMQLILPLPLTDSFTRSRRVAVDQLINSCLRAVCPPLTQSNDFLGPTASAGKTHVQLNSHTHPVLHIVTSLTALNHSLPLPPSPSLGYSPVHSQEGAQTEQSCLRDGVEPLPLQWHFSQSSVHSSTHTHTHTYSWQVTGLNYIHTHSLTHTHTLTHPSLTPYIHTHTLTLDSLPWGQSSGWLLTPPSDPSLCNCSSDVKDRVMF